MEWDIKEHRNVVKILNKLPNHIVKKYDLWKQIIWNHGPNKLLEFPGFNDDALVGDNYGHRSSRLNIKYRVIYFKREEKLTVYVLKITPHKY